MLRDYLSVFVGVWCDHDVNVCGNVIFLHSLLGLGVQGYRTLSPGTDMVHL